MSINPKVHIKFAPAQRALDLYRQENAQAYQGGKRRAHHERMATQHMAVHQALAESIARELELAPDEVAAAFTGDPAHAPLPVKS